ncbi:unnamed protein product [Hyaloperonospora brassicae]|uniref:DDE-1 domain-containing protein n=1 Tax=Hyaloperonospora brassicae TaxID=162125 RepID=A0AAV0T655_HYABA|nr:unnamed protein product [Hyaloperonospora brassicae]
MRNFKAYYRRRFDWQLLDRLENYQPDAAKINFLEAIQLAHAAWTLDVQPECNLLLENPDEEQMIYTPTEVEILDRVQMPKSARGNYIKEEDSVTAPPVSTRNAAPILVALKTFWLQQETGEEFSGTIQKMQDQVGNLRQKSSKQQTLDIFNEVVPRY